MKKLTVCFTLTLLFALSVSAQSFKFYLQGNAITKYGDSPKASFFVTLKGIQDTGFGIKKRIPVNIHDTINDTLTVRFPFATSCSLLIVIKKEGFLIDSSRNAVTKCDSFSWNTTGGFNLPISILCHVTEKCPKIVTKLNYTGSLLQWKTDSSTIVDSQSLWISRDNGLTYIRLDSFNILTSTQSSYPWIPPSSGGAIIKIKTINADSSDSSSYIYYSTKITPVNKTIIYSTPQKSVIFNVQGQLIYKGILDLKLFKFSSGKYFIANKTQLILN